MSNRLGSDQAASYSAYGFRSKLLCIFVSMASIKIRVVTRRGRKTAVIIMRKSLCVNQFVRGAPIVAKYDGSRLFAIASILTEVSIPIYNITYGAILT